MIETENRDAHIGPIQDHRQPTAQYTEGTYADRKRQPYREPEDFFGGGGGQSSPEQESQLVETGAHVHITSCPPGPMRMGQAPPDRGPDNFFRGGGQSPQKKEDSLLILEHLFPG